MAEQTTSGGGSTPADDVPPTWMGPEEIGEEPGRSALVGTNRTEETYRSWAASSASSALHCGLCGIWMKP